MADDRRPTDPRAGGRISGAAAPPLAGITRIAAGSLAGIAAGSVAGLALPPCGQPLLLWPALALLWQLSATGSPDATTAAATTEPAQGRRGLGRTRLGKGWLGGEALGRDSLGGGALGEGALGGGASGGGGVVSRSRKSTTCQTDGSPISSTRCRTTWSALPLPPLLWGAAAVLASHRWLLWLHPLDWVGVPLPLSLPLCLLIWLLCGLLGGLLVAVWSLLVRRLDPWRPSTALLAPALWGLAEVALARGPLFWIGLGSAALPGDPALAGLARLGGAGLLAAVQLLIGWGVWRAVRAVAPGMGTGGRAAEGTGLGSRRWRAQALALGLGLPLALHLLGLQQLNAATPGPNAGQDTDTSERRLPEQPLLVLQPAIPTRRKFSADQQRLLLLRLAAAQRQAAAISTGTTTSTSNDPVAPVLVLPEGSLALGQGLPLAAPVEVLAGGFRLEGESLRSSLLRLAPSAMGAPNGWVDKHRLVPLGEWVPFSGLLRWSGLSAVGGVQPGPPSRLLARPGGAIGVAICYEIADGVGLADAARAGAGWLLASANLDPYPASLHAQFTALARLRALETGRWLVSAANTGPSLVVDPAGHLQPGSPTPFTPATALLRLQPTLGSTPYLRLGEGPLLLLLAAGAALRLAPKVPLGPAAGR